MKPEELVSLSDRVTLTRREALRAFAAGIAALEAGCLAQPGDDILPYVADPPETRPGVPIRYASALTLDGYAHGVIVETRDGRPIKLDGNPVHPATRGGSTPALQARILDLYDPQRAREVTIRGEPASWQRVRNELAATHGRVWLVMPPWSSRAITQLLAKIGERVELHVVTDAPLSRRETWRGHARALGEAVDQQVDVAHAEAIAALDADWLSAMPMSLAWARDAGARRTGTRMLRHWICEPVPTPTGSLADERLPAPASDVVALTAAIASALRAIALPPAISRALLLRLGEDRVRWARNVAGELARGHGAVIVGDRQPALAHALARLADRHSQVVTYTRPAIVDPLGTATLGELAAALRAREVDALVIVDANPIATAPHALELRQLIPSAPLALHVGLYADETAHACPWRVPLAHELEAWADARGYDGTLAIAQPVIRPRFPVVSPLDVLAALADDRRPPLELVQAASELDVIGWRQALATGVVSGTAEPARTLAPSDGAALVPQLAAALAPRRADTIEIALAPSRLHDGRFATNAWLQELPHAITKQTWGNAAVMSPATAAALGADDGRLVRLETSAGRVELPAIAVPGCAEGVIALEIGYGRAVPELPIAHAVGGDALVLRGDDGFVLTGSATVRRGHRSLARTQIEFDDHGRECAPQLSLADLHARPDILAHLRGAQPSLLPEPPSAGVGWGMTIDTSRCTGCSACMVACQAENNIAIVGEEQVARGRHMNWLRVDRYVDAAGDAVNQPLPCQHCERAPCEYVCPVEATEHSPDGLNEMVYNRCVGTRFCSNNCPYKVRRFNWFAFEREDSTRLQYNPDVTVRSRGVMEKCTYCVQRIRRAEIASRVEARTIREGEVQTACVQACPTGAIVFGRLSEQTTEFARTRNDRRRYELLHGLGTRPRTIYLAKLRDK